MSDIKLFQINGESATELTGEAVALERSLQTLIESNLEPMLGISFLKTEHSTGPVHGGRIDTLGIDENKCPVIIEYKRATNENVINQGLFYLDWLMDHQAEFKLLVLDKLGRKDADEIDWSQPRLLCIAGGFTKYDEHAVKQINRNIELIRYKRFGTDLLVFELLTSTSAKPTRPTVITATTEGPAGVNVYSYASAIEALDQDTKDLYEALRAHLLAMGDDVSESTLSTYVAYKRLKNFATVQVFASDRKVKMCLKVDPGTIQLENGFTRDVSKIGHQGTGDLEVTLTSLDDLERAKTLIQQSYENS
jgi:predicted transport protein